MTQFFEPPQSVRLTRQSFIVSQFFKVGILAAEVSATGIHFINGVLGGRSFSSDKTNRREALSSCAGSSAQAVKSDAQKSPSVYERSSSHGPPATAFLIDTLPIRITPKPFACNKWSHSNRHSSATPKRTILNIFPAVFSIVGSSEVGARGLNRAHGAKKTARGIYSPSKCRGSIAASFPRRAWFPMKISREKRAEVSQNALRENKCGNIRTILSNPGWNIHEPGVSSRLSVRWRLPTFISGQLLLIRPSG